VSTRLPGTSSFAFACLLLACSEEPKAAAGPDVAAWYNDAWSDESHAVYMARPGVFTELNPFWYDLGSHDDRALADGTISERSDVYSAQQVMDIRARGDRVVPCIGDRERGQLDTILHDETARRQLIDNLVATANRRRYDGFDLNFERGTPAGRELFARFVDDLARALHARGKRLVVTMTPEGHLAQEQDSIFDYAALGATAVDRLKIMLYDYFDHGADVPGPIGPLEWIRRVVQYAIETRGIPPSKLMVAIHNYGWTWKQVDGAWMLQRPFDTHQAVMQRAGPTDWQWDAEAHESFKQYTYEGETYLSYVGDARSVTERLAVVEEFGLAGIALFILGREDPAIYPPLCAEFGSRCD
jgi:spore germination protein